jgi:hypothetical protein
MASGTIYTWKGPASGGSFTNTANWTPTGYPNEGGDVALFNTSVSVDIGASRGFGEVQVGSDSSSLVTVTLTGAGDTLTLAACRTYGGANRSGRIGT